MPSCLNNIIVMEREYANLYMLMRKHSAIPTNCLPVDKAGNNQKLKKIVDINRSIASLVSSDLDTVPHRRRISQYQLIDFQTNGDHTNSSKRIHHNSHFINAHTPRTAQAEAQKERTQEAENGQGGEIGGQGKNSKPQMQTLQEKANATVVGRRKDLYDNHIEKYMSTKYDNDALIKEYLSNREGFIQQACQEIEKEIKQDPPHKRERRKHRSRLPKIEQSSSHMLQKGSARSHQGAYLQEMSQIKKSEELEFKERRRQQRAFRHRMHSLEAKLVRLKAVQ